MRSSTGVNNETDSQHRDSVAMSTWTMPGLSYLSHLVTECADHVGVLFAEDGEVLFVQLFA